MDPRDRLWLELVFPHCDVASLLASRAVCPAFRRQLDAAPARLWLPLTMELHRMSYAERVLGWPGVVTAMAREENTRANCDAGRCTPVPVRDEDLQDARSVLYVSGRVVTVFWNAIVLFDADTGARVASLDVAGLRVHDYAVCDRWVPCGGAGGRRLLLDCVAARLVDMGPPVDNSGDAPDFTVAGPCVSARTVWGALVTVTHVSAGPDGTTAVREVARVTLSDLADGFHLCERGRAYVLFDKQARTLQLCDVATGQCRRVFTPPPGMRAASCRFDDHVADFFVASVSCESSFNVAFRISDGHCSAPFRFGGGALLCADVRVVAGIAGFDVEYPFVDAVTGAVLPCDPVWYPVVDTSGALVARDLSGRIIALGGPDSAGHALPGVRDGEWPRSFRYGVCALWKGGEWRVLRFDGAGAPPRYLTPDRKRTKRE